MVYRLQKFKPNTTNFVFKGKSSNVFSRFTVGFNTMIYIQPIITIVMNQKDWSLVEKLELLVRIEYVRLNIMPINRIPNSR